MNNYGIIYDIKEDKAVVLTQNSNFIMIRRREDMFLGQKVAFGDEDICKIGKRYYKYASVAASLAAVFALIFLFYRMMPWSTDIYGYVAVDINPSMEFGVDKDYKVVEAIAFNNDANILLDSIDVHNQPIDAVILEIIKESKKRGYVKAEEKTDVLISASFRDANKETGIGNNSVSSQIDKLLNDIEKEIEGYDSNIDGKTLMLTYDEREAALKNEISMGRYDLYLKLNSLEKNVTVDEVNAMSLSELLKIIDGKDDGWKAQDEDKSQGEPSATITPESGNNAGKTKNNFATPTPIKSPSNDGDVKTSTDPLPATSSGNTYPSKEDGSANSTSKPTKGPDKSAPEGNIALKLKHYNRDQDIPSKAIHWDFVIENTGKSVIDMRDVKVRYYFKDDYTGKLNFSVYFYSLGDEKTDVNGKIYNVVQSDPNNKYLEVTFKTGSISPGESAWVFGDITRENWTEFYQEDDWSYLKDASTFSDWENMTVYIKDKHVWGTEPF